MSWIILLSRILMAAIFIQSGINKALAPSVTMAMLTRYGLPVPGGAYAVALLVEIGAGIAFLIGWRARTAALVLAIWCVATGICRALPSRRSRANDPFHEEFVHGRWVSAGCRVRSGEVQRRSGMREFSNKPPTGTAYRPMNTGTRFSTKARAASA